MMQFIRTLIRLITGRVAFERRAALSAIEHAARDEWLYVYGEAHVAAEHIRAFLLNGEFPR